MASRLERTDKEHGMDELSKLGIKYGTDKIGKHNYLPHYYEMFKDRRELIRKVLEIGAGEGNSLRMWRDFFHNAIIYSGEIEDSRLFEEDRIKVFKFNQGSVKDIHEAIEGFVDLDIIIDDGSHDPLDQIFTCIGVMELIENKNVTYIIEDVADLDILKFLSERYTTNTIECGERYDDRLVVVKHK